MYENYKNICFKDFEEFMYDYWVFIYPEFISWYITNEPMLEKYWLLWRPYIIYHVILPAIKEKEDRRMAMENTFSIHTPFSWAHHPWPGAGD